MAKTKVAILYGGRSVEHGVSINSAKNISEFIDQSKFETFLIGISKTGKWYLTPTVNKDIEKGIPLHLNLDPQKPYFFTEEGKKMKSMLSFLSFMAQTEKMGVSRDY
jgi:D-alanine-D-alanine ligase